jgi:hypothetical protein
VERESEAIDCGAESESEMEIAIEFPFLYKLENRPKVASP